MFIVVWLVIFFLVPLILLAKRKYKAFLTIIILEMLLGIWLAHPVCQVNVPNKASSDGYNVTWVKLTKPADFWAYLQGRPIYSKNLPADCKSWIRKQFFF